MQEAIWYQKPKFDVYWGECLDSAYIVAYCDRPKIAFCIGCDNVCDNEGVYLPADGE